MITITQADAQPQTSSYLESYCDDCGSGASLGTVENGWLYQEFANVNDDAPQYEEVFRNEDTAVAMFNHYEETHQCLF